MALEAYAHRFNRVARHLAADAAKQGKSPVSFKNAYLRIYDLTARQFNAIRVTVDGLSDNRVKNLQYQAGILTEKIRLTEKHIQRTLKQMTESLKEKPDPDLLARLIPSVASEEKKTPSSARSPVTSHY